MTKHRQVRNCNLCNSSLLYDVDPHYSCLIEGVLMRGHNIHFNPIALRKAKIVYNFGISECNRVKVKIRKVTTERSSKIDLI